MKRIILLCTIAVLLSSCSNSGLSISASEPSLVAFTPTPVSTETPRPTSTPAPTPTLEFSSGRATGPIIPDSALLFKQNFESDTAESAISAIPKWKMEVDDTGNHILCNQEDGGFLNVNFGADTWNNYAVEIRVKSVAVHDDEQYFSLFARVDSMNNGYNAALNFVSKVEDLQFGPQPYIGIGNRQFEWISGNVWYLIRLEVAGSEIKYYIDNFPVKMGSDIQRSTGPAAFTTSPHLQVCVDDIRVWTLNTDGSIADAQQPGTIVDSTFGVPLAYPQVWGNEDPGGVLSYEFKTNCTADYTVLDTCFLWNLTDVTVTAPSGMIFHLRKDFNSNQYSGEVTRRWVLYGPPNSGLPQSGVYTFTYYKNGKVVLVQKVNYTQSIVPPATNISAVQNENSLYVSWQPPAGLVGGGCKVFVSRNSSTGFIYSQPVSCDSDHVTLSDLSLLVPGERYEVTVMIAGPGGSSGNEIFYIVWKAP